MDIGAAFPLKYVEMCQTLGHYARTDENVRSILALAAVNNGARILDVPCGTGRYAIALHRLGFDVTGIDLSAEQLAYAREYSPGPRYIVADMRNLPRESFELILNLFSSFGYLETEEEDAQLLHTWRRHLDPGGRLIIEVPDLERVRHILGSSDTAVIHDDGVHREVARMDWRSGVLSTTFSLRGEDVFKSSFRVYEAERLLELLHRARFRNLRLYGSYAGVIKRPGDRAVIVASRD